MTDQLTKILGSKGRMTHESAAKKSVITDTLVRREFALTEMFLKNENISLVKRLYALEATNYFGSLLPLTRKELTEIGIQNYSSDIYHCLNF